MKQLRDAKVKFHYIFKNITISDIPHELFTRRHS